jgi:hypothetical protein
VVNAANRKGIAAIVAQQFELGRQVAAHGLMPILEPEVTISIADKAEAEAAKKSVEAQQAKELSAADKAKRCEESRTRYQKIMNARRLYEPGATEADRRYLDANEMDTARANAKQVMDEFCAGQ